MCHNGQARECRCCLGIPEEAGKVHQEKLKCITGHESFKVTSNCLNHNVLQLSYFEYIQDNGPMETKNQSMSKIF